MIRVRAILPNLVAVALLDLLCTQTAAAQVRVRSGEHPGHSRLVFQFQVMPEWNLIPGNDRHILEFTPAPSAYLLDEVFQFIPRTRLAEISADPEGSGIVLELNCECRIEIYETRARALVVDIHDPRERLWNPREWAKYDDLSSMNPRYLMAHIPEDAPDTPSEEAPPDLPALPPTLGDTTLFPFPTLPSEEVLLQPGLTRALAEELARAASQGLVEADDRIKPAETTRTNDATPGNSTTDRDRELDDADELVRLRTGIDRALSLGEQALPGLSPYLTCPRSSLFDLAGWGTPEDVHLQIATLRRDLVGEFDRAKHENVLALARLYIYLTFDIEAVNLIRRMVPQSEAREDLIAMARLVGSNIPNQRLSGFGECDGALPLLAFLATPMSGLAAPLRKDAVLLTYLDLPPHLRRHLAEPLAERLAALGDDASVEVVLGSVERVSKDGDPDVVMASAKASSTGEISAETGAALDDLATSLKPEAAEALLINIRDRLMRDRRIPQDLVDTAEILSIEQRGGPKGQELKEAQILALLANGAFVEGFETLLEAEANAWLDEVQISESWVKAYESILSEANDATFVRLLFEAGFEPGLVHLGTGARNAIAERLLDLGFSERGEAIFMATGDDQNIMLAARLARAKSDLDRAIRLAGSVDDRDAKVFVAETLGAAGRHAEAREVYADLGADKRQSDEAWRAGEWGLVSDESDQIRYQAAERMSVVQAAGDTETLTVEPSLSEAADLVAESEGLRATLDALLAEPGQGQD